MVEKKLSGGWAARAHGIGQSTAKEGARTASKWMLESLLLLPSLLGLLLAPSALTIRGYRKRAMDGVKTIEGAVAACRQTGLDGWDLVAYAQRLVCRKFEYYSLRNLWDTPARAFAYGMGYCTQYNLALKLILEELGFEVQPVFCTRVSFVDRPEWRMGHTWLRVRVDEEWRDVCASRPSNEPGLISFEPLRPVWRGSKGRLLLTHLGMIFSFGVLEWRALISGKPLPDWMFALRPGCS